MSKLFLTFLILLNAISDCLCLGITNYTKTSEGYIINIASEDVKIFEQKLNNILINLNKEYNMIIIKIILSTILPYIIIKIYIKKIKINISFKFLMISICMILIYDLLYINRIWNDYKYGFMSAEKAINKFEITLKDNYKVDPFESNFRERKFKISYSAEEIEKYGIHAIFCEIPGTLPSKNANPLSFSYGGDCYKYDSQRRYLDPEDDSYIGDEESQKYRKIQIDKYFDLF